MRRNLALQQQDFATRKTAWRGYVESAANPYSFGDLPHDQSSKIRPIQGPGKSACTRRRRPDRLLLDVGSTLLHEVLLLGSRRCALLPRRRVLGCPARVYSGAAAPIELLRAIQVLAQKSDGFVDCGLCQVFLIRGASSIEI